MSHGKTMKIDGITYEVLNYDKNGKPVIVKSNGLEFFYNGEYLRLDSIENNDSFNSETIILPAACKEINAEAFSAVRKTVKHIIGKGVTHIYSGACKKCSKLKTVSFGKLEYIDSYAFDECKSLQYMPDLSNVTHLGYRCFKGCDLKGYIDKDGNYIDGYIFIPKNITNLVWTFDNSKVEKVIFEEGGDYTLRDTFSGCKSLNYCNLLDPKCEFKNTSLDIQHASFKNTNISEISIKPWMSLNDTALFDNSGVEKVFIDIEVIPDWCFSGCKKLTDVVLSPRCKEIKQEAFGDTENLKNINLDNVLTIRSNSFMKSGLESVKTNANIGEWAFAKNHSLRSVEVGGHIYQKAFEGSYNIKDFQVKPTAILSQKSVPIVALMQNENIDGDKINFDTYFFYDEKNNRINNDVVENVKKLLSKYEGGYYAKIGNNQYGCLIFYEGDDISNAKAGQKRDIIIHPDCTLLSDYCFDKSFLSSELQNNLPAYNLNFDSKYSWNLYYRNSHSLSSVTFNDDEAVNKIKTASSPEFPHVKIGSGVREIANPLSLCSSNGLIEFPENMDKIIVCHKPNLYYSCIVLLPKTVGEIIIKDSWPRPNGYLDNKKVTLLVRPGTDENVVKQMNEGIRAIYGKDTKITISRITNEKELAR